MVIQNNHDVSARKSGDNRVHHFERVLAAELRIGFHGVVGNDGIFLNRFVGPGQSNGIYAQCMDLFDDLRERGMVKTTRHEFFLIKAVPVDRGQAHPTIGGVQNLMAAGVKWWSDWRLRACQHRNRERDT